jgi:hypothetical protein
MVRRTFTLSLVGLAFALAPAAAQAADTYVDGDGGGANDANDCTVVTTPCLTIGQGLIQAGTGDTVHVDESLSSYVEAQVVDDAKSLVAENIDGGGFGFHTIVGAGFPTIAVPSGETAGTISGFLLGAGVGQTTVVLDGPATLRDNTINQPNSNGVGLQISGPAGTGTVVDGNTFNGDSTSVNRAILAAGGNPSITGNTLGTTGNDFNTGVFVTGGNPTISGNTFAAIDQDTAATSPGIGVLVVDAQATIRRNAFTGLETPEAWGVAIQEGGGTAGATVSENRIVGSGGSFGIDVENTTLPVTLDSNLVTGFTVGLSSTGPTGAVDDGDVSVTNMTFAANGTDITLNDTHLTLDSSIVEDALSVSGMGNPGCTITFSRGPSTLPGACTGFQTSADPGFVDAGSGDYHLLASSPMVDAGNTAAPAVGATDFEGDARSIDADGACPDDPVRDIGADELLKPALDCTPKPPPAKTKCKKKKKKKKGKSAAAAKKKKKKGCKKRKKKKKK